MAPARDFVFFMGERLKEIAPEVVADPRINRSIFRIHRDTRFSKDKTPYKDHLGILFWEGKLPKMESSGFYFHLQPPILMLGAGIHCFSKPVLKVYRDTVVDPRMGKLLEKAISDVKNKGAYEIGGSHYKRTPKGYDPDHQYAGFLLHNGLWAGWTVKAPKELHSNKIVDFCYERFQEMAPLHYWLKEMTHKVETGK
jgi:uncharacterized protein (TIGR02453 family)